MPEEHIKEQYVKVEEYPYYKEMQTAGTKVIGVWDDHDYGINDGSKDFSKKHVTREIFLDFIEEPAKSPRRLHKDSAIH